MAVARTWCDAALKFTVSDTVFHVVHDPVGGKLWLDFSVVLSFVNIATFVWFALMLLREMRETQESGGGAPRAVNKAGNICKEPIRV